MSDETRIASVGEPRNFGGRPSKARGAPLSSDAAADRWSIRGVPGNVRAKAVQLAADRGLSVGEYVAEALAAYAKREAEPAPVQLPAVIPSPDDLAAMIERVVAQQLAAAMPKRRGIRFWRWQR